MVADSEIAVSTTKLMPGTDVAPFLSYLGRLVSLTAVAMTMHCWLEADSNEFVRRRTLREVVGIRSGFHDPRIPLEAVDDERAGLWKTMNISDYIYQACGLLYNSPLIGQ